jgi:hypothetical protein
MGTAGSLRLVRRKNLALGFIFKRLPAELIGSAVRDASASLRQGSIIEKSQ